MKIAYVIDSLASKGGAERILSDKMNYMAEVLGYEVYVITCYQHPEEDSNVYHLSDKVRQVNLQIRYYRQYHYKYPMRLWVKYNINRKLLFDLTETVQRINPDVLVGLGYFKADVVTGIECRAVKVVESHEARIYTMLDIGYSHSFFSNVFLRIYRKHYLQRVERQADVIVVLTKEDAKEWSKAKRVEVIPNFTMMPVWKLSTCENKRVIAAGRLEWQKGFDQLVESWNIVHRRYPDWHLDIFGSGTMELTLKRSICSLGLDQVISIHPYTSDINKEYSESSIFALSSRYEGFGLVLLEAMQSGLPCVTFDCPFGPKMVVSDHKTGLVVKNGDIKAFADKLCCLIANENMRKQFSREAVERAKLFDVKEVMNQWKQLFESLLLHPRAK